jgi:hypothetical protein
MDIYQSFGSLYLRLLVQIVIRLVFPKILAINWKIWHIYGLMVAIAIFHPEPSLSKERFA